MQLKAKTACSFRTEQGYLDNVLSTLLRHWPDSVWLFLCSCEAFYSFKTFLFVHYTDGTLFCWVLTGAMSRPLFRPSDTQGILGIYIYIYISFLDANPEPYSNIFHELIIENSYLERKGLVPCTTPDLLFFLLLLYYVSDVLSVYCGLREVRSTELNCQSRFEVWFRVSDGKILCSVKRRY